MTGQEFILLFFILNVLLIICDASLGYFVLPLILRSKPGELSGGGTVVGEMRRLLTAMVILYMLVNCYAYFRQYSALLYIVTAIVLLDILVQLLVRQRRLRQE